MRQILSFIVLFCTACSTAIAEPLFWQAKKGQLEFIIFGSVHAGDESMYPLPNPINNALKRSNGLILEADLKQTGGLKYPSTTITTADVLDDTQQAQFKQITQSLNLPHQQMLLSPPWATALTIQMKQFEQLGYLPQFGVDAHVAALAQQLNKPLITLESLQFQIDLIAQGGEGGKELLLSSIEEFDETGEATRCLIDSWKAGDKKNLERLAELAAMSPELTAAFLTDRNHDWADKLSSNNWKLKQEATYLVVVGAMHLIGEQSLIDLLKARGFEVVQLSKSEQTQCEVK
ncbi:TraB/GumN family protein [Vibrio pelagius]|uniref:TraB/GumN family protein n=1 Tax=Vibrio pelagius TaxID=28169 RepID=UPI0021C30B9E|nr:TraB/GumN family protein [Vibrio pelagius]